jgi:hypothetical protein
MNFKDISKIDDSKWFKGVLPVKRPKRVMDNPCIVGFDTEFIERDGKLQTISIQFSQGENHAIYPVSIAGSVEVYILHWIATKETILPTSLIKENLVTYLVGFLKQCGYKDIPENIYLVSHFSQAELGNFDDLDEVDIFQANKTTVAKFQAINPLIDKPVTIHVKDLYGIFSTRLEKIGDYIGIPKLSLGGIDDKPESYWYDNMDLLCTKHPDKFMAYAVTDATICYVAYTEIRQFFLDKFGIDILHFNTLPSIAGYLFRLGYLKENLTPVKTISVGIKQRKVLADSQTKFYSVIQKQTIFDGDLNTRRMALDCYHGARVESFYRGRLEDVHLVYYDIDSLYPSATMLQPLPVKDTEWINLHGIDERLQKRLIKRGEGFVEVEFSFPRDCKYPCLPVADARENVLYFTSDGVSCCTLSELRMATKLGCNFKILSGYAFFPTNKEINHPFKKYMADMLQLKRKSSKGSLDYELFKLLANALVGKLIEKLDNNLALALVKDKVLSGDVYRKVTGKLRKQTVGSLWLPEAASLILGKSRSLISEFVNKDSYFVSTDSVLLPATTDIACAALAQLKSVGSNLKKEYPVTHAVLIRSRLYSLNPLDDRPDNIYTAGHSVHMSKEKFLDWVRWGLNNKKIPNLTYTAKRLVKLDESITRGKPLNTSYVYEGKVTVAWDGKRQLLQPVENPFSDSCSFSTPLSFSEINQNKARKAIKEKDIKKRGRKPRVDKDLILGMSAEGKTVSNIARTLQVSKPYVSKVKKKTI